MGLISNFRTGWDQYQPIAFRNGLHWRLSGPHAAPKVPFEDASTIPPHHDDDAVLDALLEELSDDWERGERPPVEEYLDRLGSAADAADIVALVYHEFCLAELAGLNPDPVGYLDRFPGHREHLDRLLGLHAAIDSEQLRLWAGNAPLHEPAALPEAGDELGPYRLLRELGRGAFARVFLAEQGNLDDRLVVVKVSTRGTPEPRLLARARHAHIVEVLLHAEAEDGALQILCMPFLGGATLEAVLAERRRLGGRARTGRELLTDLDHVAALEYPASGRTGPSREILAALPYPGAVAWIVARLAEALDHAHSRGVTHGDLKPSNILLTADARPMLFDFNLSIDWQTPADPNGSSSELGGTLAYMAPERLRAFSAPEPPPLPRPRDRQRADIYALGLILAEALTGHGPDVSGSRRLAPRELAAKLAKVRTDAGRFLSPILRRVPLDLRPILSRCLAPDPADRYGRAAELADDLDRARANRALRFAAPPNRRARVARWGRRHRPGIAAGLLLLAGAVPVGFAGVAPTRTRAATRPSRDWRFSGEGRLPASTVADATVSGCPIPSSIRPGPRSRRSTAMASWGPATGGNGTTWPTWTNLTGSTSKPG